MTTFSRAVVTASHTSQFIYDMHQLGIPYTEIALQVEAISRAYQRNEDDSDYRQALRQAYADAVQVRSYEAVDGMKEGAEL